MDRAKDFSIKDAHYELFDEKSESLIDLALEDKGSYYYVVLTDQATGVDIPVETFGLERNPRIYNENDLNLFLQKCFPEDDMTIDENTDIAEWQDSKTREQMTDAEFETHLVESSYILADIQKTVLHEAVERVGSDIYFRSGNTIAKVSLRYIEDKPEIVPVNQEAEND